jgi:hypothetical protein
VSVDDDDQKIPGLDAWEAPPPPAGFVERVMQAHQNAEGGRPRSRRPVRALWGAALLVAAAAGWLIAARAGDAEGEAAPAARASLTIGRRGVAVAEAGAQLRWQVKGGVAQVHQNAGSVFYRVDKGGGAFVVETPAGRVTVQGTCFRVEVNPMWSKQAMMAAGVGAVTATALLVTVYEGRVLLANEHGQTTLAAGEQASVRGGGAPGAARSAPDVATQQKAAQALDSNAPGVGVSREELLARDQSQRAELARLQARVHDLETGASAGGGGQKKDDRPFFDPSKDELQALAKECRLKWDAPSIGLQPQTMGPKRASEVGLSDQERAELNRVNADENQRVLAQLRILYIEVTGDRAGADSLTPEALENEIMAKSPDGVVQQVFQKLSHERAGLQAPPADATGESPAERMMRMMTTLGDDLEQRLGATIGPDRARQLRSEGAGWGGRHQSSYGCPSE